MISVLTWEFIKPKEVQARLYKNDAIYYNSMQNSIVLCV